MFPNTKIVACPINPGELQEAPLFFMLNILDYGRTGGGLSDTDCVIRRYCYIVNTELGSITINSWNPG
jgi:hypothetical protein